VVRLRRERVDAVVGGVAQAQRVGQDRGGRPEGPVPLYPQRLRGRHHGQRHGHQRADRVGAGLQRGGTGGRALREGRAHLRQALAEVRDGGAWLVGAHIASYDNAPVAQHDPDRPRKLLLHRGEIDSLAGKVREKGFTLVPTRLYFKDGRVKVAVSVAKGKQAYDKRETIKAREAQREVARAARRR